MLKNIESKYPSQIEEPITPASIDFLLATKFNEAEQIPGADLSIDRDEINKITSKYLRGEDNGTLVRVRKNYYDGPISGRATIAEIRIRNPESSGFSVVKLEYISSSGQYELSVRLSSDNNNESQKNRTSRIMARVAEQEAGITLPYATHDSIIALTFHTIENFNPYVLKNL